MKGLDEARRLYEERGRPMLAARFPEYEGRIAVGLAGHGSECFGFDDELSRDHDFDPGFCLWVDDETCAAIGPRLAAAYRELVPPGLSADSGMAGGSRGVIRIGDFYRRYTGSDGAPESWRQWLSLPLCALAEASNGQVWRDDSGAFSAVRDAILHGMPEDVRKKKLAASTVLMAQSGQYNYSRCVKRGEPGAAMLAMAEFVDRACQTVYLLNRAHMPYYKWQLRGMERLALLGGLREALEFLLLSENSEDGVRLKAQLVEDVCAQVIAELRRQGLSHGAWDYLEPHAREIMNSIEDPAIRALHIMDGG